MSLLKKLFSSSEQKFRLQLDETATQVAKDVQEQIDKVKDSQPVQDAVETVTQVAEDAKNQVQSEAATKEEKQQPAAKTQAKTTPAYSGASSWEEPFWVKAMYKNSGNGSNGKTATSEKTFATDYLMPTITKSRRRPGASLNKFKEMASKAKTPKG